MQIFCTLELREFANPFLLLKVIPPVVICQKIIQEGHPHLVETAREAITVAIGTRVSRVSIAIRLSTIAVAKGPSCTVWAIGIWSELLGELLLLCNGILDSLLLGSDVVLVLLLLSLHELLALVLSLLEGLFLGLTDLANL